MMPQPQSNEYDDGDPRINPNAPHRQPPAFKLTKAQHAAMQVLISRATYCALGGGSRSGKTFLLVRAVIMRAFKSPGSRHAIFRFRFNSVKASIIYDTFPKVMKLCFPGVYDLKDLNKTDWFYKLPNGSEIWFCGLDDKDRTEKILGLEFATIYFNECSQIPWPSIVTAISRLAQKTDCLKLKAYYDFNPPSKKHWTYMQFVEKRDPITKKPYEDPFNYGFYLINPKDNQENISSEYIKILEAMPEKARNRFLLGRFADDDEGALWTEELLAHNRVLGHHGTLPDFLRIGIAVDPSGCRGSEDERSDEIGIIVGALGVDGHVYILEDLSGKYPPETWADIVNHAYERHGADCIIGEVNYGGDLVRANIHAANSNLPYKEVRASRGKVIRAEPISSLYQQAMIHHVGYFPELEDQMCAMTVSGYQGLKSPDRADACIWLITELYPKDANKVRVNPRMQKVVRVQRDARRFDRGRFL